MRSISAAKTKTIVQSPSIRRHLRLTLDEVVGVAQATSDLGRSKSYRYTKDLREVQECLNSATVWTSASRPPLDVSVGLLRMVIDLLNENRTILERFGDQGFSLLSVHTSFQVCICYCV